MDIIEVIKSYSDRECSLRSSDSGAWLVIDGNIEIAISKERFGELYGVFASETQISVGSLIKRLKINRVLDSE